MDIKVTSTDKVFYQIDPAVAALLIEAFPASFERVNPKPTAPTPAWGIGKTVSGFSFVKWTMADRNEIYDGPPAGLSACFAKMGLTVPAAIVERYASVWEPRPI